MSTRKPPQLPAPTGDVDFDMNTLRLLSLYGRGKAVKKAAAKKLDEMKLQRMAERKR